MRVDLPDDHWVEMRGPDELVAGDRIAVNESFTVPVSSETTPGEVVARVMSGAIGDHTRVALLRRIITAWSFDRVGLPIPSLNPASIEQLPLEAYNRLRVAIEPHMDKVNYTPSRQTSSDSATTSQAGQSTPAA